MGFLNMTADEYCSSLEDFILKNPGKVKDYFSLSGHTDLFHKKQTDMDMKVRCMEKGRDISTFLDYVPDDGEFLSADDIIENALLYKEKDISEWMTERGPVKIALNIPFDNVIGYGYQDKTLEKMDTPVLRMVLKKDPSDQFFGFKVLTSYPYLRDEKARYLRQFVCSKAGIDPYRDGKLTVPPEKLSDLRQEMMTKEEAREEIKNIIFETLKADRDRKKEAEQSLLKDFCREYGIPLEDASIENTVNKKNGRYDRSIVVYGRTVGFIKADKGYVAEKYRGLGEVQSILRKKRKTKEKEETER
ncbi:MAG: RNase A-like domain-containing protein [Candidatus Weimeria sp.]